MAGSELFEVLESVEHPEYDQFEDNQRYNFRILRLNGNSTQTPLLRVNENENVPIVDQSLTTAGWGATDIFEFADAGQPLQVTTNWLTYISNEECQNITDSLMSSLSITEDLLCTRKNEGILLARGDQGMCTVSLLLLCILHHIIMNATDRVHPQTHLQAVLSSSRRPQWRKIWLLGCLCGHLVR